MHDNKEQQRLALVNLICRDVSGPESHYLLRLRIEGAIVCVEQIAVGVRLHGNRVHFPRTVKTVMAGVGYIMHF